MSAKMAAILKLLFLCALAHSDFCLALPASTVPKTYETTTDPPTTLIKEVNAPNEYLIVRGEGDTSLENPEFKIAASTLLNTIQHAFVPTVDELEATLEECSNPSHKAAFSGYDYTVLLAMLVISLGIGVFYGFFHKSGTSSNEFLLGSEMSIFPVTLR